MKFSSIRPIPKYILKLIKRTDEKYVEGYNAHVRFYAYLAVWSKELVKVTVAVKHKGKKWYCKQVAIHGIHSDTCFVKDMEYCGLVSMGFRVGWYQEGIQKSKNWYESEDWCYAKDKYYDPWATVVNPEFVKTLDEYKYSAYDIVKNMKVLQYLRLYEKYPQLEMLVKLGFTYISNSTTILKLVGKEKSFIKWLIKNKETLRSRQFYKDVIVRAYKSGKPLTELQRYKECKLKMRNDSRLAPIKENFKGVKLEKLFDYIAKQNTDIYSYLDYFKACQELRLDMNIEKNVFPHNFNKWHDIRIDEYNTMKAIENEKKHKELYAKFFDIANKYVSLEHKNRDTYICVIAKSPSELLKEGDMLNHCVGCMNYDQKFIREESLIFFIRTKENPNIPFVTVEYSLASKKILQCYGDHNSTPAEDVLYYVNKVWLPYAKRNQKKISA